MQAFTFIHAADLHLDAALPAPSGEESPVVRGLLSKAVFMAMERLVNLCIAEDARFLIIAGDLFHSGAGSLKANLEVADAFKKLEAHGIEVFWARGNHDSLSQSDKIMNWPGNVHIFSADGESLGAGGNLAALHGISHTGRHERDNLAEKLKGTGPGFNIGVLHCAVNGVQGQHAAYAPCGLTDLAGGGKSYWALGHVHNPAVLAREPLVIYPGSLQGLHINETGPHGCYVVRVGADDKAEERFTPLAPVRWEKLQINAAQAESPDVLEELAIEQIGALCDELGNEETPPELLLLRLDFSGRTPLDAALRKPDSLGALTERLNVRLARLDGSLPFMARLKDISLSTSPDIDMSAVAASDNLVGEALRRADAVALRLEELAAAGVTGFVQLEDALAGEPWGPEFIASLKELYGDRRLEDARGLPDIAELAQMAREAATLCLHMFEVEQ